ncbi:MAG: hypothetical protein ABIL58_07925 [Pseudomonadota bacterium]
MNGKKAKELRRMAIENNPKFEVRIQVFPDGRVEVIGFPDNFIAAMDVIAAGQKRVAGFFLEMSKSGNLDDRLNLVKDQIIRPTLADIRTIGKA